LHKIYANDEKALSTLLYNYEWLKVKTHRFQLQNSLKKVEKNEMMLQAPALDVSRPKLASALAQFVLLMVVLDHISHLATASGENERVNNKFELEMEIKHKKLHWKKRKLNKKNCY
jgi:hypothetical protein